MLSSREDFKRAAELVSGDCTVPVDVEHCHGAEVAHEDGVTECFLEERCEAPDALHAHGYSCSLFEDKTALRHRCSACRD